MCLLGCTTLWMSKEGQKKVDEEGCNLSCRFRSISLKALDRFQPYYTYRITTWPRCAFWGAQPSWRATKVKGRSKKVVTCHVVSGAYLEKCLTHFSHITHTWSPHGLDVPFGVYNPLKVKRSKKVATCHVVSGAYLENCSMDFNHALDAHFGVHNPLNVKRRL
jgi:hypothetical protein